MNEWFMGVSETLTQIDFFLEKKEDDHELCGKKVKKSSKRMG